MKETLQTAIPADDTPIAEQVYNLECGETLAIPAGRAKSGYVRSMVSSRGFDWQRTFTVTLDRDNRRILVRRIN